MGSSFLSPSSYCRTVSVITRTTSSLWFSLQGLPDLDNRRVAGSTRLILPLADLRLVQLVLGVLVTELSLCSSLPAGPHSPRTQPDWPSYIRALLLLALLLPPLVRFGIPSVRSSPEHRSLQAKTSTPLFRVDAYASSTQKWSMVRSLESVLGQSYVYICSSSHPVLISRYSVFLSLIYLLLPSHNYTNVYKYTHLLVQNRSIPWSHISVVHQNMRCGTYISHNRQTGIHELLHKVLRRFDAGHSPLIFCRYAFEFVALTTSFRSNFIYSVAFKVNGFHPGSSRMLLDSWNWRQWQCHVVNNFACRD